VGVPVGVTLTVLVGEDVSEALSGVVLGVELAESEGVAKREGEAEKTHTGFLTADTTTSTPEAVVPGLEVNTRVREVEEEVPLRGRAGEPEREVSTGEAALRPSLTVNTSVLASVTADTTRTKRK